MADIMASVQAVHDELDHMPSGKGEASQELHPTFGPHPNTKVADFNFEKEVDSLPFKLKLDNEHWAKFIDLIYSNQEVFSLHDKDLAYCGCLTHTNLTSTDKPVYLPYKTILRQLWGEVYECLNTWLHQGIIHPSSSPYASQVVTVCKRSGEDFLCVDYRKLNSITIQDAFPVPCIDET